MRIENTVLSRNFDDDLMTWPHVNDCAATVNLISSLMGFDNFDNMSEMLESVATIEKIAKVNGIDVNNADSLLDLRRMFVARFNGYVDSYNKDPELFHRQQIFEGSISTGS